MNQPRLPRLLCVMGSGETAPTMTSVHAELLGRVGPPPVPAVLLDTPFGFQENADDISARAQLYFRDNVGVPIEVATFRNRDTASPLAYETVLARIAAARYVFAGPGSPSYALRQWRGTKIPELLARKLHEGGCITFASAAAVGLGVVALPVYEVYKVGEQPRWLEGLDLLSEIGLRVALIPHYNNAEGGTHDTRYCYMGERRLRMLEDQLPDDVDVLGVDEHTALLIDVDSSSVRVTGRGGVTWRHRGHSRRFENGVTMPLRVMCEASASATDDATRPVGAAPAASDELLPASITPFMEGVEMQSRNAERALAGRDVDALVATLLEIDTQMHEWAADTLDSDERDRARELLRRTLVRLGDLARDGAADPRQKVGPVVDRVLGLRTEMRAAGEFGLADKLRDALLDAGIEVRDTPDGTAWDVR